MDIVKILRASVDRLPNGSHTVGLLSILRHIDAAVRHFERGRNAYEDSYTDAIYRTNQAFEGSLKEAYRVLTGKDPSGLTPNQIEIYLESNSIIRSRVLIQLQRYRQDYRNPSTHDHKLDFDEDESLLALLSVCAFAKLLVDQISSKLVFNAASEIPAVTINEKVGVLFEPLKNGFDFRKYLVEFVKDFIEERSRLSEKLTDIDSSIAGLLSSVGVKVDTDSSIGEEYEDEDWDILTSDGKNTIPIEIRYEPSEDARRLTLLFARKVLNYPEIDGMVLAIMKSNNEEYIVTEEEISGKILSILHTKDTSVEI